MSGDLTPGESVFHVREREAAWGAEGELGGGIVEGGGGGWGRRAERQARGEGWNPERITETREAGRLELGSEVNLSRFSLVTPGPPSAASRHSSTRRRPHPAGAVS